jgi:hypothetical protein
VEAKGPSSGVIAAKRGASSSLPEEASEDPLADPVVAQAASAKELARAANAAPLNVPLEFIREVVVIAGPLITRKANI